MNNSDLFQTPTSCQIRSTSWSSKRSKVSKNLSKQSATRCLGAESDTPTITGGPQYPQANSKLSYGSQLETVPASSTSPKAISSIETLERTKQPKIQEPCNNFLKPPQYSNMPMQRIVPGNCPPPAPLPSSASSLSRPEVY